MKDILISAAIIIIATFVIAYGNVKQEAKAQVGHSYNVIKEDKRIYKIRNCEYILSSVSGVYTHCGDCCNPIHYK